MRNSKEAKDAAGRQVKLYKQTEAHGGPYRGGLRETRHSEGRGRTARMGDRQQREWGRQEERIGPRQGRKSRTGTQGRTAGRCRVRASPGCRAFKIGTQSGCDAKAQSAKILTCVVGAT